MTDAELLTKIKSGLGITGTFQDETLQVYIDDTKEFLKSAGVKESVVNSPASVGCILQGVTDKWVEKRADYSEAFKKRLIQLSLKGEKQPESNVKKLAPYFYKIAPYDELDYELGTAYFEKYRPQLGGCAVVEKDGIIGRNYDWTYDKKCSFIVRTNAINGRHETLGVSVAPSEITQEFIASGQYSELYKIIPFYLLDGINDAGLFAEINVVPAGDKGYTTGTNRDGDDLCAMLIPRYVLDNAATVEEAITLLQKKNIFAANSADLKEEFHFLLSDPTQTVVIEFVENEMVVIDSFVNDKAIMTNFYLSGYNGTRATLTPYAQGIERDAILQSGYNSVENENDMLNLMRSVLFTNAYKDLPAPWYSEFAGKHGRFGDLTKDSPPEAYAPIMAYAKSLYQRGIRDGQTWQTVHTSIYNREKGKLIVSPQETSSRFTFYINVGGDDNAV